MSPPGAAAGRDEGTRLDRVFDGDSLAGLRAAVLDCAVAAGLPDDRAMDVMLVLHELAANTVRHGSGRGRLRIDVLPRSIRAEVSEPGPGAVVERPSAAGRAATDGSRAAWPGTEGPGTGQPGPPDWPVRHGHGLWLVQLTADQVEVTSGPDGTVVTVFFSLSAG